MTGLSIGHGSQNMVEIESVTLCTHNKLSLWNGMIDLQRWCLHLELGSLSAHSQGRLWTFSFRREIPLFFSNWVKGGMWKNVTKRFSFFDSIVQFGSKTLKIMLKSVPLFGSYHWSLNITSSFQVALAGIHGGIWGVRAIGRDDMTSKPGWSTDVMEFVSWLLCVWIGEHHPTSPYHFCSFHPTLSAIMRSKI